MALIKTALAGQGGRLFTQLRDKQSLAYAITAFRSPGLDTGVFGAYIACDPSKTAVATEAIFEELDKMREKGLNKKELEEQKANLLGNLQIGLQTNGKSGHADGLGRALRSGLQQPPQIYPRHKGGYLG